MKRLRILLIGAGCILILFLVGLAVVFSSGFQTWAVRRALARTPGLQATVGRVDAGWNHVRIENLRVVPAGGAAVTVPSLEIALPLRAAIGGRIQIDRIVARGWIVDLTTASPVGPDTVEKSPVLAAGPGILRGLELPFDLSVGTLDMEGEMVLPAADGTPPVRARVSLNGGGLGAGREATFQLIATTAIASSAPVNSLDARGALTISMLTPRTFSSVGARLDLEAKGSSVPQGARLSVAAGASQANSGESYTLAVRSEGRDLLVASATHPDSSAGGSQARVPGTWTLNMRDSDLTPFTLGRPIPGFTARGSGKFDVDGTFTSAAGSGHLDASVERLGVVQKELEGIGALTLTADFDVANNNGIWRIGALSAEVAGAAPVMAVRVTQPFEFDSKTRGLKADASRDLLTVDVRGVPVAWVQPFVAGVTLTGNQLRGSLNVSARDGGFAVRSAAPFIVDGLSVRTAEKPMLRAVDASVQLAANYTPQGWQAEFSSLSVRSGGAVLMTGEGKAGQLAGQGQPVKVQASWAAMLHAIGMQPLADGMARLSSGTFTGDVTASLGARGEFGSRFALNGLVLESGVTVLPAIAATARVERESSGKLTLDVPLTLEAGGRKSDLAFRGSLTPSTGLWTIDGRVESNFLALEDAQVLGGMMGPTAPAGPATPAAANARDQAPLWAGIAGRVELAAKKLVFQEKFEMTDVAGTIRIMEGAMRLEGLRSVLSGEGRVAGSGALSFDVKATEPYSLQSDLAVTNFESAPLFLAMSPGQPPTIEGRFNLSSKVAARAGNLPRLAEKITGQFQLSSRAGVSRLLRTDLTDKIKGAGTIAAGISLIAGLTGQDRLENYGQRGAIVVDITKRLETMTFDQLNLVVNRGDNLEFNISDFSLITPELRLGGTGVLRAAPNKTLLEQSMELRLELGARGALGEQLKRVSLLDTKVDELGYTGFTAPFTIGGTPSNPDKTEFANILLKAAGATLLESIRKP